MLRTVLNNMSKCRAPMDKTQANRFLRIGLCLLLLAQLFKVAGHKKVTKNWKRNWYIFGPFLSGGEIYQHQFLEIRILHTIGTYIIHSVWKQIRSQQVLLLLQHKGLRTQTPVIFYWQTICDSTSLEGNLVDLFECWKQFVPGMVSKIAGI